MEATIVPVYTHDDQLLMQQELLEQQLQQQQLLQQQQQMLQQQQQLLQQQMLQQDQKQCAPSRQQQRQQQQQQQLQPQQQNKGYSTCGGEEGVLPAGPLFVEKMSLLMEQLATCGEETTRRPSVATRFDVFVFALIYLDRVIRANHIKINALNIHRLILAASVIGIKFVEDIRYSNRYYARVGGVGLAELNRLELAFLKLVKFDLTVSKEEYAVYRSTVLLACPKRPVANHPATETTHRIEQQQQEQQQQPVSLDNSTRLEVGSHTSEYACQQLTSRDATKSTEQLRSRPLLQQQQQQQLLLQKCSRGFAAVSTASTVSTTPETGPPYLPSSTTSCASTCTAATMTSVETSHKDLQHDSAVDLMQAHELMAREEGMRCSGMVQQRQQVELEQQWHWQASGMRVVNMQQQTQQTRLSMHPQQCWDCTGGQQQVLKQQGRLRGQERLVEQQQQQQHQQQRQLMRTQQLLLLREYQQQQQVLLEQQQLQQLHLMRQQQLLLLHEGDFMVNDASMSPGNSYAPTSRSNSRDSISLCGGFGMETEDKMTAAASDEELQLASSPMNGLRDILAAEVP